MRFSCSNVARIDAHSDNLKPKNFFETNAQWTTLWMANNRIYRKLQWAHLIQCRIYLINRITCTFVFSLSFELVLPTGTIIITKRKKTGHRNMDKEQTNKFFCISFFIFNVSVLPFHLLLRMIRMNKFSERIKKNLRQNAYQERRERWLDVSSAQFNWM